MDPRARTRRSAFTYAWWLTGSEDEAARAVEAAELLEAGDETAVLAAVRASAITARTMCPASEIALLHDRHGVALPAAATLVEIDPDDARTELAHGRLEALVETADAPFRHPERLGGLAVGNPADVAHARQCRDCERARALLADGRAALRALPETPVPDGVERAGGARRPRAATVAAVASIVVGFALVAAGALTPEAPGTAADGEAAVAGPDTGGPSANEPSANEPSARGPGPSDEATATDVDAPPSPGLPPAVDLPDGSVIRGAAIAGVPGDDGVPVLRPTEPLRVAVRYGEAPPGTTLEALPAVQGVQPGVGRITLPREDGGAHVFVWPPHPPSGWPAGTHALHLLVDGEPVATLPFVVAGSAARGR